MGHRGAHRCRQYAHFVLTFILVTSFSSCGKLTQLPGMVVTNAYWYIRWTPHDRPGRDANTVQYFIVTLTTVRPLEGP